MDALIKLAESKINKYKSVSNHQIVKEYVTNNNIVSLDPLTDNIPDQYYFYSIHPLQDSNNLCNLLYPTNKYVSLNTSLIHKIFVIKTDNYPYITIELLFHYNNTNIYNVPNNISQIMNLCKKLYHPDNIDNIDMSENVESLINDYINASSNIIKKSQIHKGFKYNIINKVFNKITKLDIDYVFLSYYAINSDNRIIDYNNPIHIIINVPNNILINLVKTIYQKITVCDDRLYVINDFRLKLQIISILINNTKVPILYIYNSLSYELIPTVKPHIPHKYVILRFLFLDLLKRMIYRNSNLDILENIINVQNFKNDLNVEYVGIYRDSNLDRIAYNKNNGSFINVYRPFIYLKDHPDLRILN